MPKIVCNLILEISTHAIFSDAIEIKYTYQISIFSVVYFEKLEASGAK